jgi:hypothetical protein
VVTVLPVALGFGAAAAGSLRASVLVPAPWRSAFGQAKPYMIFMPQGLLGFLKRQLNQ